MASAIDMMMHHPSYAARGDSMEFVLAFKLLLATLVAFKLAFVRAVYKALSLPRNRPDKFKRKHEDGPVIVCLGDSLTHGHVSHDYLALVNAALDGHGVKLVNAGVNGDLAWNLLSRVGDVIRCEPDLVTILIGSNDTAAALSPENNQFYIRYKKLPEPPTETAFRRNLQHLIQRLQRETRAEIAVLSIPVLGEDPDHPAGQLSREYSRAIYDVAMACQVTYLPLHEQQQAYLRANPSQPQWQFTATNHPVIYRAMLERHLFLRSFDAIGAKRGFQLTSEGVHMNSRGAQMIAELVAEFAVERLEVTRENNTVHSSRDFIRHLEVNKNNY